jgi:two-component system, chemotaxis family, response regulator Rcp1
VEARDIKILLVEDNQADVRLLKEAFSENNFACVVTVARDGSQALEVLKQPASGAAMTPDLIILDLSLPKVDGFTVLAEARKDFRLTNVPVIVLSTSKARGDIDLANQLGATRYMSKSHDFEGTLAIAREIEELCRELGGGS